MYQLAVFIHILAAIIWVGGTLFLVMVMVPLTRQGAIGSPPEAARLLGAVARKFRRVAWGSIVALVITGLFIGTEHWGVTPSSFFTGEGWFLKLLQAKVGVVAIIIVLSLVHDFILGPRLTRLMEGSHGPPSPAALAGRRRLVMVARINVTLILVAVILAVFMTRGNPF